MGTDEALFCVLCFCTGDASNAAAVLCKADLLYQAWHALGGHQAAPAGPAAQRLITVAPPGLLEESLRVFGPLAAICVPAR